MMPRLIGELIIDAPIDHDKLVPANTIPFMLTDIRVIVRGESAMTDSLPGKNGVAKIIAYGTFPIFITHIIVNSFYAYINRDESGRCFWKNEKSWQMAGIFDRKFEWNSVPIFGQYDTPRRNYLIGVDPRSLLSLHFVHLSLHRVLLPQEKGGGSGGYEDTEYIETEPLAFPRGGTIVLGLSLFGVSLLMTIYSSKRSDYFLAVGLILMFVPFSSTCRCWFTISARRILLVSIRRFQYADMKCRIIL